MPTSDLLEIMLRHDRWATGEILGVCAKLSEEQLGREFAIGPGSLRKTVTHMIGAMKAWTDTLMERTPGARVDQGGGVYSMAELMKMHEAAADEFGAAARGRPLEGIVKRMREGKEFSFTRGAVIAHVTTHGMHHRTQCLNMLRQLGVKPLPASSVAEWSRMVDFAG